MNPQYHITQAANLEPVSLEEVTQHVRIDSIEDHAYLSELISVAREYVDSVTGWISNATGWTLTAANWQDLFDVPTSKQDSFVDPIYGLTSPSDPQYAIKIQKHPLVSVSSVKYYDATSNTLTTLPLEEYRVFTNGAIGYIQLVKSPPATFDRIDAVQIVFTAGKQDANPITKHSVKMLVAHLYENRVPVSFGAVAAAIPYTLEALIQNQKATGFF